MEFIYQSADTFIKFWSSWPYRFINKDHAFFWGYLLSFVFLSFLSLYLSFKKDWFHELKNLYNNPHLKDEFRFEIKNYGFKLLFDPFFLLIMGFSLYRTSEAVKNSMTHWFPTESFSQFYTLSNTHHAVLIALFFLLAWDLGNYLGHRLMHDIPFLWPFHAYHHRANILTPLTKYRVHPVSIFIMNATAGLFVALLSLIIYQLFNFDQYLPVIETGLFHKLIFNSVVHIRHSPFPLSYGPFLSKILVSPMMHQIHHSIKAEHINKNFGVIFAFWDNIFNTIYIPHLNEKMDIINSETNKSLRNELMRPFRAITEGQRASKQ